MKNVLITGANGFIAKKTAETLKEAGCFVIGTSRKPSSVINYDVICYGLLGEPLREVFENHRIDAVVHCAYDKMDIDNKKNAEGTYIWAEQAEKNKVESQIFISSLSADENAVTPYGQKKYELEKWFISHNHIVLRPGLVVGNGGLFQAIISMVKKSPVIPLIDKGKTLTYVTDVETLCRIIRDFILNADKIKRGRIWCLQQEEPYFFIEIIKEILEQYQLIRFCVPIPDFAVSILISFGERFKFKKIRINPNNIKGMRQFSRQKYKSDIEYLGYQKTSLTALIKKTLI